MHLAARSRVASTVIPLSSPFRTSSGLPQWLHCFPPSSIRSAAPPCRGLHLYKTAKARTTLGMHKILPYSRYDPPPLEDSQHRINLRHGSGQLMIAEGITLAEAYANHIKPGSMLYLCKPMPRFSEYDLEKMKDQDVLEKLKDYAIVKAYSTSAVVKAGKPQYTNEDKTEVHLMGPLKVVHIIASSPTLYLQQLLDKAYRFIEQGCTVEFGIKVVHKIAPTKERSKPGPSDYWPWLHTHFPHLRPDFILKSMPPGTRYIIQPMCDGRRVTFVLGLHAQDRHTYNLTERLLKVQKAVRENRKSLLGEVPVAFRMGSTDSTDLLSESGDGPMAAQTGARGQE